MAFGSDVYETKCTFKAVRTKAFKETSDDYHYAVEKDASAV